MSAEARRAYHDSAVAEAARLRRAASEPGATHDALARADRAEADLCGLRSRMAAMGDPTPAPHPVPPAALAPVAPAIVPPTPPARPVARTATAEEDVAAVVARILKA